MVLILLGEATLFGRLANSNSSSSAVSLAVAVMLLIVLVVMVMVVIVMVIVIVSHLEVVHDIHEQQTKRASLHCLHQSGGLKIWMVTVVGGGSGGW